MTLVLILSLLYFCIRGVCKGMEMTHPGDYYSKPVYLSVIGVRSHAWFPVYHVLDLSEDILLILCTMIFTLRPEYRPLLWCVVTWGWELSETGYAFARNNLRIFRYPENLFGTGIHVQGWAQRLLHFTRIMAGTLLLWFAFTH